MRVTKPSSVTRWSSRAFPNTSCGSSAPCSPGSPQRAASKTWRETLPEPCALERCLLRRGAHDGERHDEGRHSGRGEQEQPDRVGVGAAIDVSHDERRHESAQATGGTYEARDATHAGGLSDL